MKKYRDYPLIVIILFIVGIGLLAVYSASSFRGNQLYDDATYFAKRQLVFAVISIIAMALVAKLDYRELAEYSKIFLIVSIILLVLVYVVGTVSHGSARWINIGPFGFQPSEFAKLALIVYTAAMATANTLSLNSVKGLLKIIGLPVVTIILIAIENLSTALICFMIVFAILYVASPKTWYFIALAVVGILGGVLFIACAGYRAERIKIWLNPENYESGYQTIQSLYAIGSGGLFGRGFGSSIQKQGFIPESHNDMIYSIICEEFGFVGGVIVLGLFLALIRRMVLIALNTRNRLGGLIITGVVAHVAVQVIINVGVVTNTIPPTGVTLPFISYGGSSILFVMMEMGLVLSIAGHIKPGQEIKWQQRKRRR